MSCCLGRAFYFENDEELISSWRFFTEDREKSHPMLAEDLCNDM
jgi:hypothetical protein